MTDIVDRLNDSLSAGYSELRKEAAAEITRLRAKIEEMEKQEPVARIIGNVTEWVSNGDGTYSLGGCVDAFAPLPDETRLYLSPGAQFEQKAVAYLDLGVGGYMDIGTDLTDEQLASLPKGRHMLGIVGTYVVDGYVSAQPTPSIPDGWLRAIDEALVVAHIGVANESDTYEQAKAKLDNLISFHVDVATDPAVNGGWKLVPIEPTPGMIDAAEYVDWGDADVRGSCINAWDRMLAATPEAKL